MTLDRTRRRLEKIASLEAEVVYYTDQAAYWRGRYIRERTAREALMASPEIKADTEAAFSRGAAQARRNLISWLMTSLSEEPATPE